MTRMIGRVIRSGLDRVEFAMMVVAVAILVVLCLMVCADVLFRALDIGTNAFSAQFSSYAMLAIAFLPAPWILRRGQHVEADLLASRLSPETWTRLKRVMFFIGFVACIVGAVAAIQYVNQLRVDGVTDRAAVDMPRWIPLLPVPVAFALLGVEFAYLAAKKPLSSESNEQGQATPKHVV